MCSIFVYKNNSMAVVRDFFLHAHRPDEGDCMASAWARVRVEGEGIGGGGGAGGRGGGGGGGGCTNTV